MGEVRKIPHEFARTRGNTHQQTKKIPNSDELGILYWWWLRTRVQFLEVGNMLTPWQGRCLSRKDAEPWTHSTHSLICSQNSASVELTNSSRHLLKWCLFRS